ncbi:MAG: hypothetical protein U5K31_10320 [Balneolaceae bacterium]|nr:hypothetical protein [Balneolaceae bacterium]
MSTLANTEKQITLEPRTGARHLLENLLQTGARIRRTASELLGKLEEPPRPRLFLAGTGAVGSALLEQLSGLPPRERPHLSGLCNSRLLLIRERGIEAPAALELLEQGRPTDWEAIIAYLTLTDPRQVIFVDATGSPDVARIYDRLLGAGVNVVTPSKRANTFEQSYYEELHRTASEQGASYRYETTVGAGLPILSTIGNLLRSGDTVTGITGVLSGTMTFLFNQLQEGVPFSRAVVEARERGYAEPDPREDLSGEDVARKFLILARFLGYRLERNALQVESLIPEELATAGLEEFLERLPDYDDYWQQKMRRAQRNGNTLRYAGSLSADGFVSVGVQEVPLSSPMGQLNNTDNLVSIRSRRYSQSPLVIQGPGAGREVTAAGLLGDLFKVSAGFETSRRGRP